MILAVASYLFQFHKGTIKTYDYATTYKLLSHFNSIKVRLKLFGNILNRPSIIISIP